MKSALYIALNTEKISKNVSRSLIKHSSNMVLLCMLGLGIIYSIIFGCMATSSAILTNNHTKISEYVGPDEVFSIHSNSSALQILPVDLIHCSVGENSFPSSLRRCNTSKRKMYLECSHEQERKFKLQTLKYSIWSSQDTGIRSSATAGTLLARENRHMQIPNRISTERTSISLTIAGYTTYSNYAVHSKRKITAPKALPRSGGRSHGTSRRRSGGTYGTSASSTVGGLSHLEFILILACVASVIGCCCYCCCTVGRKQEATEDGDENVAFASKVKQDEGNAMAGQQETDGFIAKENVSATTKILDQTAVAGTINGDCEAQESYPASITIPNHNINANSSMDGSIANDNDLGETMISEQNLSTEFPMQVPQQEPFSRSFSSENVSSRGEAIDLKYAQCSNDDGISLPTAVIVVDHYQDGSTEKRFPYQDDCKMGEIVER